jgi:cytochrome c biogenesis protein CcdA
MIFANFLASTCPTCGPIQPVSFEGLSDFTLVKLISLAGVDAINPCTLAVLALMLVAILTYNPDKRRKILLAGLAFVIAVFIMYLIYGLIIIQAFQLIQTLTSIRIILYQFLGAGAIILGLFKLRDFFRAKRICKTNPKLNKIISKITSPKGAFLVGAFVTIFLLPCTIGPYVICCGILSSLSLFKVIPLLLLYNLIFVLPMLGVVLIIYFGLSKVEDITSWQARNLKYLDLISGLIIGALGILMVLKLI